MIGYTVSGNVTLVDVMEKTIYKLINFTIMDDKKHDLPASPPNWLTTLFAIRANSNRRTLTGSVPIP